MSPTSAAVENLELSELPKGFQRAVLPKPRNGGVDAVELEREREREKVPSVPTFQVAEEGETFHFRCPACDRLLSLQRELAGREGPCPGCGAYLVSANPWLDQAARLVELVAPNSPLPRPRPRSAVPPVENLRAVGTVRHAWSPPEFPRSTEDESPLEEADDVAREERERKRGSFWRRVLNGESREVNIIGSVLKVLVIAAVAGAIYLLKTKNKAKPPAALPAHSEFAP